MFEVRLLLAFQLSQIVLVTQNAQAYLLGGQSGHPPRPPPPPGAAPAGSLFSFRPVTGVVSL